MILNMNAYKSLFPTVDVQHIQAGTWYLSNDSVGHFACKNITIDLIYELIDYLDVHNGVTELSIITNHDKKYKYELIYSDKNKNGTLDVKKIQKSINDLISIDLFIKYPLKVYNSEEKLIDICLNHSTEIHFYLKNNIIDFSIDFDSIFNKDNRLYLALIYLYQMGLVKKGSKDKIKCLDEMIKAKLSIHSMTQNFIRSGGIVLSDDTYQYIQNCVFTLDDNFTGPFIDNHELCDMNKVNFKKFIGNIEQIVGTEFKYKGQ